MSTIREAYIPKELEKKLSDPIASFEEAIKIYESCAKKALEDGNQDLHDDYFQIIQDMNKTKEALEKSARSKIESPDSHNDKESTLAAKNLKSKSKQ